MKIKTQYKSNYSHIHIEGSISNENLYHMEKEIKDANKKNLNIIINLARVSFICSSGLALLFKYVSLTKQKNKKLIICYLSEDIYNLFLVTGSNEHITIAKTLKEAEACL